ncbi:Tetrapeptide transporter OPT1/isp4 [Macrophomina phaseolina MS6]|uniref:Tetrapeptide transporter OPT1/isp4 n=1 Tax=Macrophomina phaseolina (strain MS6) TaxID=1126212 RepID=K2SBQ0_MACPH|nr:Tetrapeptide transporter OPT1/isp4 [Macrophomina phaseolina MS6]
MADMADLSDKDQSIQVTVGDAKRGHESDIDSHQASVEHAARLLNATVEEVLAAQAYARSLSLEQTRETAAQLFKTHQHDPNFPTAALARLQEFLEDESITEQPEKHSKTIEETKLEVSLLTTNSPYAEVRAVVDNHDDPNTHCSTIRAWVIGICFVVVLAFVNQLFSVRQPTIFLEAPVVQLLSFPIGKAAEKYLPDVGFTFLGVRHSINPGSFNKKEHMLISIMASVGKTLPSSRYIIFTQFLDRYFGQKYAASFGYQILLALSTDFMGYGLAGLLRKFLVYPSFCLWPKTMVTIALNTSLHDEGNYAVVGPFKRLFSVSRFRFFLYAFALMFVWFWFPDYIFAALSLFNWLAWIAPNNFNLTAITGLKKGLGFNPLPTFDWNVATHNIDPLVIPFTVTINTFIGCFLGGITIIGMYYTNAYHTGYLPINTNSMFNHYGKSFNVSAVLDDRGWLDEEKYQAYSPVYLAASSLTMYWFSFAVYTATVSYCVLYHRQDFVNGFRSLFRGYKNPSDEFKDIHTKLMSVYREVPEWWYFILNVFAVALGVGAVAGWPTYTTVGVVFFGIGLALVFVIPTGIIYASTGLQVEYNYLAEFIGGAWLPGNALAMNFFKCYGYVTTAHALAFSNDLKLAHYVKIPPRVTFWAQAAATFVSAVVCTGVMNFQIHSIHDICES